MTSKLEGEDFFQLDHILFYEETNKIMAVISRQFNRIIQFYVLFNLSFLMLGCLELVALLFFFTFLVQSSSLALVLALIFLTCFTYFILRLYFQTKKPEQFRELKENYLEKCREILNLQEEIPEQHVLLANACTKFATILQGREYSFYQLPSWLSFLHFSTEKFSCWWHWQDFHKMKEQLLLGAIEEYIKLVKCEPTNLEVHAALANAYVILSGLYMDPRRLEGYDEDRWIPPQSYNSELEQKFRLTAERAIEEFKILNDYAPNDPWIHSQLAYSYHDLQMPEEEIREYETILELRPDDRETLLKLGKLYFQQGENAKGLRVYEELRGANYKKAENLIKLYGAYEPFEA